MNQEKLHKHLNNNPFSLAPMAGYSDVPFRTICRKMGAGILFTEFVSSSFIIKESRRALKMASFTNMEMPLIVQIFGHDADELLLAAQKIEETKPSGIELNLGCSVKKIALKGSGATLLNDPKKIMHILKQLNKNLSVPISAKIRIGIDEENLNYLEVAKIVEQAGCWLLTVHGRTKNMKYSQQALWQPIGEIAHHISIPVIGNGDINSLAMAKEFKRKYNLNGIAIGRAAQGRPWIFTEEEFSRKRKILVVLEHLKSMLEFYGEEQGLLLFRKHLVRYFRDLGIENGEYYFTQNNSTKLIEDLKSLI